METLYMISKFENNKQKTENQKSSESNVKFFKKE